MRKRIFTLLMAIAICLSSIFLEMSVEAAEKEVLMETVDETPVRAEAKQKSEKYAVIKEGNLVTVVDMVKNESGNYWYQILYGEDRAFIYSQHLVPHECRYDIDYSTEDCEIYMCECGSANIENFGVQSTSIAGLALAGGGTVAAAGLSEFILGGAVIVGSYYLLKNTVYFLVNAVGNIEIISAREAEDIENEYSNENDDIYYPALILKEQDALLIVWNYEMDIDRASDYLSLLETGSLNSKELMTNVYTLEEDDAEELAKHVVSKYRWKFQAYGNSQGFRMCEIDQKNGKPREGHYEHFHLFNWLDQKIATHIFFGEPYHTAGSMI